MKPTSWLVNTSREPIVDERALIEALRERYAHLEQDYLGAEMRKLSLIPPSKSTGQTRGEATAEGAANCDSETSVIPFASRERRKGFEPSTPSLGSWPRALERLHGVLTVPLATRRDRSRGLPEAPSGTFGMTFEEGVTTCALLRCRP
jgi:D-isomer specific 2-hydroxyacid dehydrogenase, NAD binding domain